MQGRPFVNGPGYYHRPQPYPQFNVAPPPRPYTHIQPIFQPDFSTHIQPIFQPDLSPRPVSPPQWEQPVVFNNMMVNYVHEPEPLQIIPVRHLPEEPAIIFPLVPAQNLPVSEPKNNKPAARWGSKSPDKYIPRGPVGVSRWTVAAPSGIAYRNTPRFEDRDEELTVACGEVVQGLPVTGLDGGHYIRTREGRFLPIRDKHTENFVLTKLEPDPFDVRMLQHFQAASGRRQLALLPSERLDDEVNKAKSASRFEGF